MAGSNICLIQSPEACPNQKHSVLLAELVFVCSNQRHNAPKILFWEESSTDDEAHIFLGEESLNVWATKILLWEESSTDDEAHICFWEESLNV